jgi:hypothetical protein
LNWPGGKAMYSVSRHQAPETGIEPAGRKTLAVTPNPLLSILRVQSGNRDDAILGSFIGTPFCRRTTDSWTALFITDGLMENHPDQSTRSISLLPGDGECGKAATDFHDLSRAPP